MSVPPRFSPEQLGQPIVQAPMAGGPSTPALAAAVAQAGGLGFLAAGYRTPDAVREDIAAVRAQTDRPFGVNVFAPPGPAPHPDAVRRYADSLRGEADRYSVTLGEPRHDDDSFDDKLALLAGERLAVISFTFGCPAPEVVKRLQSAGAVVWVSVTTAAEAMRARDSGANALVLQGVEAGGHRASFDDDAIGELGLLALIELVAATVDLPLIAGGGLATGRSVAGVLAAGAWAAQLGTAFMLCPEAGTAPAHRRALAGDAPTALTRAFSGRAARGITNRFMRDHDQDAPSAYPDLHHLTMPLRAAARERGDPDAINLWAGQAHSLATEAPASQIVRRLADDARRVLRDAPDRLSAR